MYIKQIKILIKVIIKFFYLRIKWGGKLDFGFFTNIDRNSTFEGANRIYPHSRFKGSLGYGSYIGPNCEIKAHIGRFCSIADHVRTNCGIHPITTPFVTTSPMFYSTLKQTGETFADKPTFNEFKPPTIIGNDVWIGENVFFTGGLTIGDGAILLAGAVVTKDVPPYAVVGGVPAKVLKYRYDEDTIKFLLDLKWWDKDINWLKENWCLFSNIDELKRKHLRQV